MEEEAQKVDLITLLRTFKKEGLDNFIVIRKEKFENNYIPKSKVKEKIEELKTKPLKINENDKYYYETEVYNKIVIQVLQELLESGD